MQANMAQWEAIVTEARECRRWTDRKKKKNKTMMMMMMMCLTAGNDRCV
jgi:hypothetical protein